MATILYAEDEDNDIFFFQRAHQLAQSTHTLHCVRDGEEALDYLLGQGPFADRNQFLLPNLLLLDINMPKKSGFEVLRWVRSQPRFQSLPVLMFTSSERPEDLENARELGANDFLLKSFDHDKLVEIIKTLDTRWLAQPPLPLPSIPTRQQINTG